MLDLQARLLYRLQGQLALMVEKAAACASRAWLRFCSTEYSCMNPFTSCGLHAGLITQELHRTL
jgi:hypothetical protein